MALDLTIVIPTKNDASSLEKCLHAIGEGFASQIVVIDSMSEDKTSEIAKRFGSTIIQFEWNGLFPKKRNWYLRTHTPATTWVLFLDSDEILTEAVKQEIAARLPTTNVVGFWLNYSIYFMNQKLRFGYPLKKLALFRVGAGEYERIEEDHWSQLDIEIHEHPVLDGQVGEIKSKIDHRDFRDISHYISKHNDYSSWEAFRILQMEQSSESSKTLTIKQQIKYRLVRSPLAGIAYFCGTYFLMGGILDGKRGLAIAILKMSYFTQIHCKIEEIEHSRLRKIAR